MVRCLRMSGHGRRTGITGLGGRSVVRYNWVGGTSRFIGIALWNGTRHGGKGPGSVRARSCVGNTCILTAVNGGVGQPPLGAGMRGGRVRGGN